MPYADPEKRKAARAKTRESYIGVMSVRFKKDDEQFYNALQAASEAQSITPSEYMRRAARECLKCDGYLSE